MQILAKIVNRHHTAIIQIDASGTSAAASKQLPTNVIELGACFVTTLLHHSDHIFRHDPEVRKQNPISHPFLQRARGWTKSHAHIVAIF